MNKSLIISGIVIATLGASMIAVNSFAAPETSTLKSDSSRQSIFWMKMGGWTGHGMIESLTDAEKASLESMTDAQRKAFFETKRIQNEAKRDARESIIDKLLAGQSLTTEEEKIRQEIITERAEIKVKKAEMDAKREQIKTIIEKKQAGTTLTTEEQALLDSMPKMGWKGKKNWRNE